MRWIWTQTFKNKTTTTTNDEIIIKTKKLSIQIKSFLNYFALKMILLNIFQNFAIYLFKYFVLHIMVIP